MNSHDFRTVVKELDSTTIKSNNINPAHFKAVAFALSMYGDYKSGTRVKPSWLTVARDACVNRKTAMKVRDFLIASGILVQISKTEANISVYEFSDNYNFQLSKKQNQMSINHNQLSKFDDQLSSIDGHNSTIDTTFNSTFNTTVTKVTKTNKPGKEGLEWKNLQITSPLALQ
jgi:hypothetical protein